MFLRLRQRPGRAVITCVLENCICPPRGGVTHPLDARLAHEKRACSIAGPKSRELLGKVAGSTTFERGIPVHGFRGMDVGMIPAMIGRITYTGDLGYEIWVAPEYQRALYDAMLRPAAARPQAFRHARASVPAAGKELRDLVPRVPADLRPLEAGLGRFIDFKKGDFIGRDAALAEKASGGNLRRVMIVDASTPTCWATSRSGMTARWSAGSPPAATPILSTSRWPRVTCREGARRRAKGAFEIEIIGERRPAEAAAPRRPTIPKGSRCALDAYCWLCTPANSNVMTQVASMSLPTALAILPVMVRLGKPFGAGVSFSDVTIRLAGKAGL